MKPQLDPLWRLALVGSVSTLALGLSSAAFAGLEAPGVESIAVTATAQETDSEADEEDDVVVVRGLRSSLLRSLDQKRNSDEIIDTITAEDINEFPDQSVVESLQRITGVQIERDVNGEGDQITVRGLRDVRLEIDGQTSIGGRFDGGVVGSALPSELFGSLEVAKTQSADDTEGGTGGLVVLNTRDPLDLPDLTASLTVKGVYSGNAGDWSEEISGTLSKSFKDTRLGDFGVLYTFSRRETAGRQDEFRVNNGYGVDESIIDTFDGDGDGVLGEPTEFRDFQGTDVVDNLQDGLIRPINNFQGRYRFLDRVRTSQNFNVQWRPTDTLSFYAETTVSEQENDAFLATFGAQGRSLNNYDPDSIVTDGDQVVVSGFITSGVGANGGLNLVDFDLETTTVQFGTEWEITPTLTMEAQYQHGHGQTANSIIIPIGGSLGGGFPLFYDLGTDVPTIRPFAPGTTDPATGQAVDFGNSFLDDPDNGIDPFLVGTVDLFISERQNDHAYQLDFDKDVDFGPVSVIEFGTRYSIFDAKLLNLNANQFGQPTEDAPLRLSPFSTVEQLFPGIVTTVNVDDSFGGDNNGNIPTEFVVIDPNFFRSSAFLDGARNTQTRQPGAQRAGQIDTWAAYIKANFDGELGNGIPYRGNFGVRYVRDEREIFGFVVEDGATEPSATFVTSESEEWLPSAIVTFGLRDDLLLRFGYGRTLSRPNLQTLTPSEDINFGNDRITRGNPGLENVLVDGFDVSTEWYFAEEGLLSFAVFYKDRQNLAAEFVSLECLPDPNSPAIEIDELGMEVRDENAIDTCLARGFSEDDLDEIDLFTVETIAALDDDQIYGFEVGYQQVFSFLPAPWDGLGVIANYTRSEGDNPLVSPLGQDLPLLGVSENSYNLTGFYEKYGFSGRLAYNFRSEFLDDDITGTQANQGPNPVIRDAFGQLDASASYTINEHIQLTFDAINITGATQTDFADFEGAILSERWNDSRYFFGIRGKL